MYIYYTHTRDATGSVILTELKLTSVHNRWQILWKNPLEDALFKLCNPLLKFPPILQRSYDENTKIWTYMDQWGVDVLSKITATTAALGGVTQIEVPDLQAIALSARFDPTKQRVVPKAEDFFYQTAAPAQSTALTREQLRSKLAHLLQCDEAELDAAQNGDLKKLYRRAALRLHPDRNNGDGAQMSELNMLWRLYNA